MARKPTLTVQYTRDALRALDEIWEWKASRYDRDHANHYIDFLKSETKKLEET